MSRKANRGRNIDERGQGNLLALVVSLFVLTTTVGFCLILIDGAYRTADRNPEERHIAVSLAEELVSEESNLTVRVNVINRTRARSLTRTRLNRTYPVSHGTDIRIQLGNETILKRGDPTGGTTIRRVVLIEHQNTVSAPFRGDTLTLPPQSSRATITIGPAAAIMTVRANDRVALHAPSGLEGTFDVDLSHYEETELWLEPAGAAGSVTVTHYPVQTTKTELVVTVDG